MRLDEIQAAFLSVKLRRLNHWNLQRQQVANVYYELLNEIDEIILPTLAANASHVYHQFIIRTSRRDQLKKYLAKNGIDTLIHYPVPPFKQKAYLHLGYKQGDFLIAEELANTMLSLPIWPGIEFRQIEYISMHIKSFFKGA
jgi:dTDP-4-amino-4,6-dideoxygalactose transaminase